MRIKNRGRMRGEETATRRDFRPHFMLSLLAQAAEVGTSSQSAVAARRHSGVNRPCFHSAVCAVGNQQLTGAAEPACEACNPRRRSRQRHHDGPTIVGGCRLPTRSCEKRHEDWRRTAIQGGPPPCRRSSGSATGGRRVGRGVAFAVGAGGTVGCGRRQPCGRPSRCAVAVRRGLERSGCRWGRARRRVAAACPPAVRQRRDRAQARSGTAELRLRHLNGRRLPHRIFRTAGKAPLLRSLTVSVAGKTFVEPWDVRAI